MLLIYLATLTLLVGSEDPTFAHTLVKTYAEPMKGIVDILLRAGNKPTAVGILDAENHIAPILTGEYIIIESRAHAPYVKRSRRRRGKSYSYFAFHVLLFCHFNFTRISGRR